MMYEVLLRRYQKALEENDLPDLVLLDGGKGQLNVAQEVFKELKVKDIDLISLAKERPLEEPRSLRIRRKPRKRSSILNVEEPFILGKPFANPPSS